MLQNKHNNMIQRLCISLGVKEGHSEEAVVEFGPLLPDSFRAEGKKPESCEFKHSSDMRRGSFI